MVRTEFGYSHAMRVSKSERESYLEFAVQLAERAGRVILPFFRQRQGGAPVENKALGTAYDPVTQADRDSEAAMREAIGERYPNHGVYGEEYGFKPGNGLTWVLDPIDGTRAFVMGLLHWGTLVALFDGQKPLVGVMHQPFVQETFAGDGTRALWRRSGKSQLIGTRACDSLATALCATTSPDMFRIASERRSFERIRGQVRNQRYGTDCYAYAMLAMGQMDLVLETSLKPYDVQALMPIVEGAGGLLTSWDGGNPAMGGAVLASGDPVLHAQVIQELQS